MTVPTFQSFVEQRLSQSPRPSGNDATDPRYWVGAGEVMLDILLAATGPTGSDVVLAKIANDIAKGDPVAPMANQLLELWAAKKGSGATVSLGDEMSVEAAGVALQAYRAP